MLLLVLLVFGSAAALTEEEILNCSLCQFTSHYVHLKGNYSAGNKVNFNKALAQCKSVNGCEKKLSHCELISSLAPMIPDDVEFHALSFAFRLLSTQCLLDPEAHVIDDITLEPISCPICKLMYNVFKNINNGIISGGEKYGPGFTGLLGIVCGIIQSTVYDTPGFCYALLGNNAAGLSALEYGILDTLGPFYNQFGKAFGCPTYQDLFTNC